MRVKKTAVRAVLYILIFCLLCTNVLAEGKTDAAQGGAPETAGEALTETPAEGAEEPEAGEVEGAEEEELFLVLDEEELSEMVAQFMRQRGLKDNNFSMAYCYTGTGETWSYNGGTYFHGASLYKLSLIMGLARLVASGELQQTDQIAGMDISYIEMRSLTYSDNAVAEKIIEYFYPFRNFRLMQAEIAGIPEEELPEEYFSSIIFSSDFMMGVLKELYWNQETYPNVVECMLNADPYHYFRFTLEGKYKVAQKYGGGNYQGVRYLHTAGIVYTSTPFLLVVMTRNATNAEYVIAGMADLMADYTNKLSQRIQDHYDELERIEQERIAAEEAARLEAERIERERIAAEEAEKARIERERQIAEELERIEQHRAELDELIREEEERSARRPGLGKTAAASAAVMAGTGVLIGLAWVFTRTKRKQRHGKR